MEHGTNVNDNILYVKYIVYNITITYRKGNNLIFCKSQGRHTVYGLHL